MAKFVDRDHPMLRPLWVRLLLVAFCAGWAILEFATGAPMWGLVFLALGGYAGWAFFLAPDSPRE